MKFSLPIPSNGSSIESFLNWEASAMQALAEQPKLDSIWTSWQAQKGLCITGKESRFANYSSARQAFEQQGLEVAVRRSGGTTVPHGPGILCITDISASSKQKNIKESYQVFCQRIQKHLNTLNFSTDVGPCDGAYCDGDYNVLLDNKKLVGTSQRWKRGADNTFIVMSHAVMLVTCDPSETSKSVNDFHELADNQRPYDMQATTSLWQSPQNKLGLSKDDFFKQVQAAFKPTQIG